MAASDKNLVITPNISHASNNPKIVFSAADGSTNGQDITLEAKPLGGNSDGASLNFTGEHHGVLMSVTDQIGGSLFSVSDDEGNTFLEVNETGNINLSLATGSLMLPNGTTAQRTSDPIEGALRWNSEIKSMEIYNGDNWVGMVTDYLPSGSTMFG